MNAAHRRRPQQSLTFTIQQDSGGESALIGWDGGLAAVCRRVVFHWHCVGPVACALSQQR